jgi:prophage maintenance system killer protein
LDLNRSDIEASEEEKFDMVMAVAEGRMAVAEIAGWIRSHLA